MPYVESLLARELDLRFIDARNLAAEARIGLGIEGYPTKEQSNLIFEEAVRLFQSKSDKEQSHLRQRNWELEAVKMSSGSSSAGSDWLDSGSDHHHRPGVSGASSERPSSRNKRIGGILGVFRL